MKSRPHTQYSHRNSLIHDLRTYKIKSKSLNWQDDDTVEQSLFYTDIISVQSQYSPTRVQSNRYFTRLKTKTHRYVDITNSSYISLGKFEEHNERYSGFIQELNLRISENNNKVLFKKGHSLMVYIFSIVIAVFSLIVLIGVTLYFFSIGIVWVAFIKLVVIIFLMPRLFKSIVRNKPSIYDPANLPAEILPE